jgi:hypothetical protein
MSASGDDKYGFVPNQLQLFQAQGQFKKQIDIDSDGGLQSWITNYLTCASKLNNANFYGFGVGQVMCGSFDAQKQTDIWKVEITFEWLINPNNIAHDDWQYSPTDNQISANTMWARPIRVTRDSSGKITGGLSFMYDYADFSVLGVGTSF